MNKNARGIDVSSYQGVIDFKKVKASGVDFVIIRAGWGWSHFDPSFLRNIREALDAGLEVGAYWFIYAYSLDDIKRNASAFVKTVADFKEKITMRLWADWEGDSDADYNKKTGKNLDKKTRTEWVKAFTDELNARGFDAGVYANPDYLKNKFGDLSAYPLWLAHYSKTMGNYPAEIWQKSSAGKVDGISGNVDENIYLLESAKAEPKKEEVKTEPAPAPASKYIVKSGDTLSKIAKAYKTTVDNLLKINPDIKDKNKIYTGQIINVDAPTSVSKSFKVKVIVKALNVREEPTTASKRIDSLWLNNIVELESESAGWGKLKGRAGYISMLYVKRI